MTSQKDLRPYIDTLFPYKDGVKPTEFLKEGENYDIDTLTYVTPAKRSDAIRDKMVEIMDNINVKSFVVYDVCGCVGGTAISFLSSDKISNVITYEMVPERAEYLKRNINLYDLGHKSIIYDKEFNINTPVYTGSAIFFDPPWLTSEVKGSESSKDQYINRGMKIGDNTLEEYLKYYSNSNARKHYLVAFHLPPNYELDYVEDWIYEVKIIEKTKDGKTYPQRKFIFCTSEPAKERTQRYLGGNYLLNKDKKKIKYLYTDVPSELPKPSSQELLNNIGLPGSSFGKKVVSGPIGGTSEVKDEYVAKSISSLLGKKKIITGRKKDVEKSSKIVKPVPVEKEVIEHKITEYDKLIEILPVKDIKGKNPKESAEQWITQLRSYIAIILSSFVSDDKIIIKMLDSASMGVWAKSLTHKNYSDTDNYESLETHGDGVLKYVFRKLMMKRFPKITSSQISNYETYYMAKMYQADMSIDLKFPKWLRVKGSVTKDMEEDILESFVGAMDQIGDTIEAGTGPTLCIEFLNMIFKDVVFNPRRAYGNPKMLLEQTGTRLLWDTDNNKKDGVTYRAIENNDDSITVEVIFNDKALKYMDEIFGEGEITNPVASSTMGTKKAAKSRAFMIAYNKLYDMGFTQEYVNDRKAEIDFETIMSMGPYEKELLINAQKKALKEYNTNKLKFVTNKTKKTTTVELVIKEDGNIKTLQGVSVNGSGKMVRNKLFIKVLENYVSSSK